MPELPEVEVTRLGIAAAVTGKSLQKLVVYELDAVRPARLPRGLLGEKPSTIGAGSKLLDIERRGKYLLLRFERGTLVVHLRMSGVLKLVARDTPPLLHDHVDLVFEDDVVVRFHDPRRFGSVQWVKWNMGTGEMDDRFSDHLLGPEPFDDEFNAENLFAQTRNSKQIVKAMLMDQTRVAGIGNIYANEALFRAGVRPQTAVSMISRSRWVKIVDAVRRTLIDAIQAGGTTLKDYGFKKPDAKPGYFQRHLDVYGRAGEPCNRCGAVLVGKSVQQRQTVYCPRCQK